MKTTNKFNLPEAFVNYAYHDKYSRGDADISVTQLIDAPQVQVLRDHHWGDMEQDLSDKIWAIFGTTVHEILEGGAHFNHVAEERLYASVLGVRISGAIDLQQPASHVEHGTIITDYKTTSAWAIILGKKEWHYQLNCYAHLVEANKPEPVVGARVCAIVRDWMRKKAETTRDYPQSPIMFIDIPLWPYEVRRRYIEDRVRLHIKARQDFLKGKPLPHCSMEERWQNPDSYAIMARNKKKNAKSRATRVLPTLEKAQKYIEGREDRYLISVRHSEPVRCTGDYCGVAKWCPQYRNASRSEDREA